MRMLFLLLLLSGFALRSFPQVAEEYETELSQGAATFNALGGWRGVFHLRADLDVPINFEIRAGRGGAPELFFHNADELFEGGAIRQTADSLFIPLNQFDNELAFRIQDDALTGELRRQDGTGQPLAISATRATTLRFSGIGAPPAKDISGTYAITFVNPNGKEDHSVGIFKQSGSRLVATFLRVTGDSRYLEGGSSEADSFRLSSFIGSGPSLYAGARLPS